ncbi:hypothetical protein TREES_T100007899 [Tupaia chinensis]|uniref:Uncharacterized protein n=1 Tax=Tupaia chinensis TaxID=246437 RepID=L9JD32_TUPCH|nr:hypothetical protein TREES_T100007899 [Tupaia chinensis]
MGPQEHGRPLPFHLPLSALTSGLQVYSHFHISNSSYPRTSYNNIINLKIMLTAGPAPLRDNHDDSESIISGGASGDPRQCGTNLPSFRILLVHPRKDFVISAGQCGGRDIHEKLAGRVVEGTEGCAVERAIPHLNSFTFRQKLNVSLSSQPSCPDSHVGCPELLDEYPSLSHIPTFESKSLGERAQECTLSVLCNIRVLSWPGQVLATQTLAPRVRAEFSHSLTALELCSSEMLSHDPTADTDALAVPAGQSSDGGGGYADSAVLQPLHLLWAFPVEAQACTVLSRQSGVEEEGTAGCGGDQHLDNSDSSAHVLSKVDYNRGNIRIFAVLGVFFHSYTQLRSLYFPCTGAAFVQCYAKPLAFRL